VAYTVSITTGQDVGRHYALTNNLLAQAGWNGGSLIYPANAGVFTNEPNNRPTNSFQASNYFRDIEFVRSDAVAPDTVTVTYQSGALATLTGSSSQRVVVGEDTQAVTVVPNPGYRFVRWSDGVTTNPRTDTAVTSDLIVTAVVELIPVSSSRGGGGGGGGRTERTPTPPSVEETDRMTQLRQIVFLLQQLLQLLLQQRGLAPVSSI
jgi:hypothetical protein